MDEKPKSQSVFRFGTRDLLWAMVVLGLGIGFLQQRIALIDADGRLRQVENELLISQSVLKRAGLRVTVKDRLEWYEHHNY